MNVHHNAKTVDIWLTRSEARDENFRQSLEPYLGQFKAMKYFVSVFESGERDLFSDTILLLRHNLELQIKAELAAEQAQAQNVGQKVWHLLPVFTPEPALLQTRLSSEAQDCGGGAGRYPVTAPGRPIQTPTQNTCASQIAGNTVQASYGKFRPVPRFW